jgi:oligopeptide transport system substrate-binding protein
MGRAPVSAPLTRTTLARLVALVVGLALVGAACEGGGSGRGARTGQPGANPGAVVGGTLVDLQNFAAGAAAHIDPALSASVPGSQVTRLLFDGLTEVDDESGELRPMVAESWESSDEAATWTFTLRDDVTFHNGEPVLPSDFKFAWERVLLPELGSDLVHHLDPIVGNDAVLRGETTELEGVVADDDAMTLTVSLRYSYSAFPESLSHSVFSPVPRRMVQALEDPARWEREVMIGNGPFELAEPWGGGGDIELQRYDDYWGGLRGHTAYLDAVEFRGSDGAESAFRAFRAGRGDTATIPPGRFEELQGRFSERNATEELLSVHSFGFNMEDPVVGGDDNLPLRQAIALAIDKQAIVDTVHRGSHTVATGHTPPRMPGYEEGLSEIAGAAERDVDRARALLQEWGGAVSEPIRLSFELGGGHEPVAEIIQANLAEIGIPSVLDGRDPGTYAAEMRAGEGQLFRTGWTWHYVAYDNGIASLFHSESIGGDNLVRYADPEVDELIARARATLDEDDAEALYRQAETRVLDAVAVVPLTWPKGSIVYDEAVTNLTQSPLGFVAYDEIWLEE